MAHTHKKLEEIIHAHNQAALMGLFLNKPWLFPTSPPTPAFATAPAAGGSHAASVSSTLGGATFPGSTPSSGKSIGTLKRAVCAIPGLVQKSLCNAPTLNTEAVFSVIDKQRQYPDDSILPVILCVGINYQQFKDPSGGSSYKPAFLTDATGMRPYVAGAFTAAAASIPSAFHLVATNFFPWITNVCWSATATNSIQETLLMHACGHDDPVRIIASLIHAVEPEFVVFHGANNCVPTLGRIVHQMTSSSHGPTILCDNLSRPTFLNSVVLP